MARPPRLPPEAYQGERTGSFTVKVSGRRKILTNPEIIDHLVGMLRAACEACSCTCLIYCFMPDHVHIILRGVGEKADLREAMIRFKTLTGGWMKSNGIPKFQTNFHDRILRWDELRNHAVYVARNPERGGLVESFTDYPFLGSFVGPPIEVLHSIGDGREFR